MKKIKLEVQSNQVVQSTENIVNQVENNPISYSYLSDDVQQRVNKIKTNKNHIYFYCTINQDSCLELIQIIQNLVNSLNNMRYVDFRDQVQQKFKIHLHINSNGGQIHSSLYLYDYLISIQRRYRIDLITYAEGIVASGATLLYLAGVRRYITKSSFIMIHQLNGQAFGKHNQLNDIVKLNNIIMNKIYDIYMLFIDVNRKKIKKMLQKDVYLDYQQSLDKNLSTDVWE